VLDVGCNRELSITGAETSLIKAGDTVESRAPIATMSAAAGKAPVLYIELRENGRPVDPKL
jgi:septal ring factor EnvC (AmiA/AmiB activator)